MKILNSSFRDPSGFVFSDDDGRLLRQVNKCYESNYEMFMQSGLYDALCKRGLLIGHSERADHAGMTDEAYKVIEPEHVSFISYPYEWSFNQLRDAALATLDIQKTAMEHGMWLKDAGAYNMQFHKGKPVFIDTLSFEKYIDGRPWQAYGQFCRHFLAPLALMSYTDMRLNQIMRVHLDGIPLDLASRLLPFRSRMSFSLLIHIYLHAGSQQKYAQKPSAAKNVKISKQRLEALILGLRIAVERLKSSSQQTEWRDYYDSTSYREVSFAHKKKILASFVEKISPEKILAFDIDPHAVDAGYRFIKKNKTEHVLPLIMDLTNPSPGIGWANNERMSLISRPLPDTLLALALIHHLAISNNLPLSKIARFFSSLAPYLIIEFVPKSDSQVQRLLASRKDIFPDYTQEGFIKEFEIFYEIREVERIADSERSVFLMQRR